MEEIFKNITRPTLIVDSARATRNIERMSKKANRNGVVFRPHFKTHQSAEIGEWFRSFGIGNISVSSFDMAEYFANHGWEDITVAIPANLRQASQLESLGSQIRLNIVLESLETVKKLQNQIGAEVFVWLKIDVGYHRTGLLWNDMEGITTIARSIEAVNHLRLAGLLTHAGHTYGAGSRARIMEIFSETARRMKTVQATLANEGIAAKISVGDTPGCSIVEDYKGVDEIRPGNFVFYDISQLSFGSCNENDIAVGVACPVIAKHLDRNEIVIYGGAVHLSKEHLNHQDHGQYFGAVCLPTQSGWSSTFEHSYVASISQEHGIIKAEEQLLNRVKVGDLIIALPVHSCLTVNLFNEYVTLQGQRISMFQY